MRFSIALVAALLGAAPAQPAGAERIDFARDVEPVLASACIRCHGAALPQGRLRLDSRAGLLAGGASGPVVVAGNAPASLLYQRLVIDDPAKRMPWLTDPLSVSQIDTLRRWIDEGAAWPVDRAVSEARSSAPARPVAIAATLPAQGSRLEFNRDVRPILSDNCFACHGPDRNRRQAGLRLDREESAKQRLASGSVAIVPSDPEKSALLWRVTHEDEQKRMPHVSSGKGRLAPAQIATLRRWIAEGAPWQPHWSHIPPTRPALPAVRANDWPRNPVDRFILAGIEKQGLAPSPAADRRELLRRLSFDLVGLPPSAEETRAFLEDTRHDAYERQVDRLLASPHYGERMAASWLDLVRYADSVGYHSDNARSVWRYRDYVIDAFNENMPFDRFTVEQLAGDLLEKPTLAQRVASGYNRLLQTTEEGGAQPKEYRAIYLADRVRNASTVWMASTLGCAQCHDHKFDPFLGKDFYSFAAFFADVQEKPVGRRDTSFLPDEKQRPLLEAVDREIDSLQKRLRETTPELELAQEQWEKTLASQRVYTWTTLEPILATAANGTRLLLQGNDFSVIAAGPGAPKDRYTVTYKTQLDSITAFRLEAVTFEELPKRGPGRDPQGGFDVTEFSVFDPAGRKIELHDASASTPDLRAAPAAAIDGKANGRGWALEAADGESHRLVAETKRPVATGGETTLTIVIDQNQGGNRTLGRFRVSATADAWPVRTKPGRELNKEILAIAARPRGERTPEQSETIARFYRSVAPELAPTRAQLRAAEVRRDALVQDIPHSLVTVAREPEPVRILPRGNWLDESGEIVMPAVPQFLPPVETGDRRATRLDLARWLTSRENPLTARVLVNRLWKLAFGEGLVRTSEDLGSQGELPTHPELLDWLAVELVDWGWDVKHMVRTLVTSEAYRQSAHAARPLVERDPYNRLFARQSRVRLEAEAVRDNALAVAGLLSPKVGGPSVHPYQPKGYWAHLNFPPREWDDSPGEEQYRRGLYTHWQRAFLHPSLMAFDAPTREECVAERTRSNTPQQALALLNDPTYVEAARAFAERILREGGQSFEERLLWAYARALAREPRAEEAKILAELLRKHRDQYRRDKSAARQLLSVGMAPSAGKLDPAELAAWTSVARAILSLPELITRP